jgi:hypothetical protein
MTWKIFRRMRSKKSETMEGDYPAIINRVAELEKKGVEIVNIYRNGCGIEGRTAFNIIREARRKARTLV